MAQEIKQGNIFGRIGSGLGRGLAEQLPKEIERGRLSSGLETLAKESENLSPFQRYSKLLAIPGMTPQGIQSGAELLKQEGINKALVNKSNSENALKSSAFNKKNISKETGKSPSLTTRDPIEATLENYIPKNFEQIQERAGQLMQENPALYGNDPEKALNAAATEEQQNININNALQTRRQNEQGVQNTITEGLRNQRNSLGAEVPANVYDKVEDNAINAVKPLRQGGEGLTEQEAKKKYGKELDAISRDYEKLKTIGGWRLLTRTPSGNKESIKSLRTKFKERGDLENFADTMIKEQSLSPSKAYYLAYPVSDMKELNNEIIKIPELKQKINFVKGYPDTETTQDQIAEKTFKVSEKLSKLLGKDGSPLSVAEELRSKGYDPRIWMNYLDKNRGKIGLTERQARELDQPRDFTNTIDDLWMFSFSGLDKLMEQ